MNTFLTLALAAASAAAAPTKRAHVEFGLAFAVGGEQYTVGKTYYNIVATSNGTSDSLILKGVPQTESIGSLAYFNGTASTSYPPTQALDFYIDGQVYGAILPEVGDAYGTALPIPAVLGEQQFEWGAENGTIEHSYQLALDNFLSCVDVVDGVEAYVLKWGVPYDDIEATLPDGCSVTDFIQNFDQ